MKDEVYVNDPVINTLLKSVNYLEREAVLLRIWDGLTFREIGEALEVSTTRANQAYKKALRMFCHPIRLKYLMAHYYLKRTDIWDDESEAKFLKRLEPYEHPQARKRPKNKKVITRPIIRPITPVLTGAEKNHIDNIEVLFSTFLPDLIPPPPRPWMAIKEMDESNSK